MIDNQYVFSLNSDYTIMDNTIHVNPVLKEMNPNLFYYFYCIEFKEFHAIVTFLL